MLGEGVIHGNDGILERAVFGHGAQANDPGGGLLGAANDIGHQIEALGEKRGDQVGAVVHGDLGLIFEGGVEMGVVSGVVLAFNGEGRDAVILHQAGGDFVLSGERVGRAEDDLGAAIAKRDGEIGRFAGDVKASGDAHAFERLLLDETLADQLENGHLLIGPFDLAFSTLGQSDILDVAAE